MRGDFKLVGTTFASSEGTSGAISDPLHGHDTQGYGQLTVHLSLRGSVLRGGTPFGTLTLEGAKDVPLLGGRDAGDIVLDATQITDGKPAPNPRFSVRYFRSMTEISCVYPHIWAALLSLT
jgi:hypothetical protein